MQASWGILGIVDCLGKKLDFPRRQYSVTGQKWSFIQPFEEGEVKSGEARILKCTYVSPALHIAAFLFLPSSALGCVNRYVSVRACVCPVSFARPSLRPLRRWIPPIAAVRPSVRPSVCPPVRSFWPFVNFWKVSVRSGVVGGGDGNAVRDLARE